MSTVIPRVSSARARKAIERIATELRGELTHGATINGVLRVDELDVAIDMRVSKRVAAEARVDYHEQAISLLAREGWRDHCDIQVPNRGHYYSSSRRHECLKPPRFAVVHSDVNANGGVWFAYRCHVHKQAHAASPSIVAVIELRSAPLVEVRKRREERHVFERRLYAHIEDNPGARFGDLAARLGCAICKGPKSSHDKQVALDAWLDGRLDEARGLLRYCEVGLALWRGIEGIP